MKTRNIPRGFQTNFLGKTAWLFNTRGRVAALAVLVTSIALALGLTSLALPIGKLLRGNASRSASKTKPADSKTSSNKTKKPASAVDTESVAFKVFVSVTTDKFDYAVGDTVHVTGTNWQPGETVVLQFDEDPQAHPRRTYYAVAGFDGRIASDDLVIEQHSEGIVFTLTATGGSSGEVATRVFTDPGIGTNLDQLHNGTASQSPEWANGNINTTNSCYSEGDSVPYRYFVTGLGAIASHTFTIQFDFTKGGKKAFDYLTDYNLTEGTVISGLPAPQAGGGPCSNTSTNAPSNCVASQVVPVGSFPATTYFPAGYGGEALATPRQLYAYNVASVSFSGYTLNGSTASNSDITLTVTFTPANPNSDVGFFWGGHLAKGTPATWGVGNGSGAVSGAPFHMHAFNFDNGGGANQDRSIQNGAVCLPPQATITADTGPYCPGSTHTASAPIGTGTYTWTVTGGTILSGQGTRSISFSVDAGCGENVTIALSACSTTGACPGDSCCNSDSKTISVNDTTKPVITAYPTGSNLGCNPATLPDCSSVQAGVTATDNCGTPTINCSSSDSVSGCTHTRTFTVTATDGCGNYSDSRTVTYTWTEDTTGPTITPTGTTLTLGCNPTAAQIEAALGTATATDACGSVTATHTDSGITSNGCSRSQTRTWSSTDACGNASTASRTVTWTVDTEPPVITLATAGTLGCNPTSAQIAAAFGTASVSDNCSTGLVATGTLGAEQGTGCTRTITKSWTVTDSCGNVGTNSQTLTFTRDTENPVITLTPAGTLGCNPTEAQIAAAFGTASVSDNCSTGLVATGTIGAEQGTGCIRTVTKTWTTTDGCGNVGTNFQTVTFTRDTENPVITLTAAGTLGCNPTSAQIAAAFGTASVTDNCSVGLVATGTLGAEQGTGCTRTITKSWTVTDGCGNVGTNAQTVTFTRDIEAPFITATGTTLTLGCNPLSADINAALGSATATDNCNVGTPTFTDSSVTGAGCLKSQTRTWIVSDACGNPATPVSRTVTWTEDHEAPTISATGANPSLGCNPTSTEIEAALGSATATDNCGPVTPTVNTDNVVVTGCSRSQTRTWYASDGCGNAATPVSRTVTWTVDTTPPTITATGTTLTLGCNPSSADINAALGSATATDNCGVGAPTFTDSSVTGAGCLKSQTRTWNVSDACGNPATPVSRTVTWTEDHEAPTISATGANPSLGCNPTSTEIEAALGTATATDNCGPVTPTVNTDNVVVTGCSRSQTRTWYASDGCGNAATPVSRTVTWTVDTTPPTINATGTTTTLGCNPSSADINAALGSATATDNCGVGAPTFTDSSVTGAGCLKSQTRTWNVSDACGNPATPVSRTVTWTEDNQAPVISATGTTLTLGCNPTASDINAALGSATATDNCGVGTPTFVDGLVTGTCLKSQTRTWNVSDACGNAATPVSRTVTWTVDTTPPTITPTGTTTTLDCNPTAAEIDAALGTATATDACGSVTPTPSDGMVSVNGCYRSQTRTWTLTDACGNSATPVSRTVTWKVDITPPTITPTGTTLTLSCNPSASQINAALGTATATDNCGAVTPTPADSTVTISGCNRSQTRTWNVTDACGNAATPVSRTVTWTVDTTLPVISCPPNVDLTCDNCNTNPDNTGWATATDGCSTANITYTDQVSGTCPKTIIRTWKATDACGNFSTCQQTIECMPPSVVTNTERCIFDVDPSVAGQQFKLIYTQGSEFPNYKLNASNPGQFFYNVFYTGTPGTTATFNVTLPYPFETQGANPVHAYDGVNSYTSGGTTCLTPGNEVYVGSQSVTVGCTTAPVANTLAPITVTVPPSGFLFIAIHIDYGLKGCAPYNKNTNNDAINPTTLAVVIPNLGSYNFAVAGNQSDTESIQNINDFKRNPGVGGMSLKNLTETAVAGATVKLKDQSGNQVGSAITDSDGYYSITYKHTGKAATYTVTIATPSGFTQTKSVALKANAYFQVDFTVP